jgi:DNA phosphorothioation-dependent restriction protein DptH
MSAVFEPIRGNEITRALEESLLPRLRQIIESRAPGHCMRIADLDRDLMISLAQGLRRSLPEAQVFILSDDETSVDAEDLCISSTKLVELRNPKEDGNLRPPLLVFLPPNLRVSAEDSFGVATFEEIVLTDTYQDVVQSRLTQIPIILQGHVKDILNYLETEQWLWSTAVSQVRFLLTAIKNGVDAESLGAALYELGLIPDFKVFQELTITQNRIAKNLDSVRKLTYSDLSVRGRTLELGLSDKNIQRKLMQLLIEKGVSNPCTWTQCIVTNRQNWDLSFDKWRFSEESFQDQVTVTVLNTDLPIAENEADPRLQNIIGQQFLAPKERRRFKVSFQVDPHPTQIRGLDHFSVQLLALAQDTENQVATSVGVAKNAKAWKATNRKTATVTLSGLDRVDFEEGWHLVRVLPWTEEGDPIPIEHNGDETKPSYESEPFYVIPGEEFDEEPPQRAIPREESLEHARLRLQFTAISDHRKAQDIRPQQVTWAERGGAARRSASELLTVKFGRYGAFQIPVARRLKELEQAILKSPSSPVSWRLQIVRGQAGPLERELTDWPTMSSVESFLAAREQYFKTVLSGDKELISQAADFLKLEGPCTEYAQSYLDLLEDLRQKIEKSSGTDQQKAIDCLRVALAVDTVHILITNFMGQSREAALIGPTHPLRALWLTTWAHIAQQWLKETQHSPEEYASLVRDALLHRLVPLHMPSTVTLKSGRIFTTVQNLNAFWALYAPAAEQDVHGLLGDIYSALSLPSEPAVGGTEVTGETLASRIRRYLIQHPYVRALNINTFNPGRGNLLRDALLSLQKHKALSHLSYNVRLFVPNPESPGVGDAVEELLSPTGSVSTVEADAFSRSSGNHLFPKLSLAILSTEDFYRRPEHYRAHISILLDLFPAAEIGAAPSFVAHDCIAPVYGLIQDFKTEFQDNEEIGTYWKRQPLHGRASPFDGASSLIDLLVSLPRAISGATSTVATGIPAFEQLPISILSLDSKQRELIHQVHDVSDWVLTIDRNMGIEFFDHGGKQRRPDYLIDYTPSIASNFGHRLVITTRSLVEIEALVSPVLRQYGLSTQGKQASIVLGQLRSLSGRLALKLSSSPNQQAEAVGLALSRLFLEHQGALSDQVIVPLDDCLELFRRTKSDELSDTLTLKRTDLALFNLDAAKRTIQCNLIEVKCYRQISARAYEALRDNIVDQILESEAALRESFDPVWKEPDRPDRLLKTREFATLLQFYLDRSVRYGVFEEAVQQEAESLLATLERGYELTFTRSALIFDFDKPGAESLDRQSGVEFYRIGIDLIRDLIAGTQERVDDSTESLSEEPVTPSFPQLESAAFMVSRIKNHVSTPEEQPAEYDEAAHGPDARSLSEPAEVEPDEQLPDKDALSQDSSEYDVLIGISKGTPQRGILGEFAGRKVALDLNQTHTISLFGVQGGGKSYTLGSLIEMACMPIPNINTLPYPLAAVVFHYSATKDYEPEFLSMGRPNSSRDEIAILREQYNAEPQSLDDIVLLTPRAQVEQRRAKYPDIEVLPISFASSELKASHWKFLMGAVGTQSMYLRQVNLIMRKLRRNLTLDGILREVDNSSLSDHLKDLARTRLQFAAEYIDDSWELGTIIRPGRLVVVDLRDEFIGKDEALGIFVVMLQIFAEATLDGQPFNKLIVFDEAHKYIDNPDLVAGLIEVVREMRHKGTSILVASQEPRSVPVSLIELSSEIILHRFNSPGWLKHVQRANAALSNLTPQKMSSLRPGEAYIWSGKSSDDGFTRAPAKVKCRPRVTQHGGGTKTADRDD